MENILRKISLATICLIATATCYAGNKKIKRVSLAEKAAMRCVNDMVKVSTSKKKKQNAQGSLNLYKGQSELKRSNPLMNIIRYLANKLYPKNTKTKTIYTQNTIKSHLSDFSDHIKKSGLDKKYPTLDGYVAARAKQTNKKNNGHGGKKATRNPAKNNSNGGKKATTGKVKPIGKVETTPSLWQHFTNMFRRRK
jgi:hypothetical protein